MARTRQVKTKKKKWYTIIAPKFLGERPIGETHLEEVGQAVGRTVEVNLMHITGDPKTQSVYTTFQITHADDNKLFTRMVKYNVSASSIKRYVRRRMSRIDDSLVVETKDNILVRLKPFVLTRSRVSRDVQYNLRKTMRQMLTEFVENSTYDELFERVTKYQIQRDFRDVLSKIYPCRSMEMRVMQLVGEAEATKKKHELKQPKKETKKAPKKEKKPKKQKKKSKEEELEDKAAAEKEKDSK